MPKLDEAKITENKAAIEAAALKCFLKSGYNGVSVRQIADAAKTSLGNLYNYYPDKISLFRSVFAGITADFQGPDNPIWTYLANCDFPNDIQTLSESIEASVKKYAAYFKMTYIDVVEFNGDHASQVFSNVYGRFSEAVGSRFHTAEVAKKSDPVFAFVAVYLQIYYFFALKHLFKAKNIYGERSDKEVIQGLISLYSPGLKARTKRRTAK